MNIKVTEYSRILLQDLIVAQLFERFPTFSGTQFNDKRGGTNGNN
jgi:hypothetical protein